MTLTDARIFAEFCEIRDRGFDRAAAIAAVVLHASALATRVTAIVDRREAEWIAAR